MVRKAKTENGKHEDQVVLDATKYRRSSPVMEQTDGDDDDGRVEPVEIIRLVQERVKFRLIGTSPLVLRQMYIKIWGDPDEVQLTDVKKHMTPSQEALASIAVTPEGQPCLSATCFKQAMIHAISHVEKITKKNHSGAFHVVGDVAAVNPLTDTIGSSDGHVRIYGKPKLRSDVGRTQAGGPVPMNRPEFEMWAADLQIEFAPRLISAAHLTNLINIAGFLSGVGDCRVAGKKNFGMRGGQWRIVETPEDEKLFAKIVADAEKLRVKGAIGKRRLVGIDPKGTGLEK